MTPIIFLVPTTVYWALLVADSCPRGSLKFSGRLHWAVTLLRTWDIPLSYFVASVEVDISPSPCSLS